MNIPSTSTIEHSNKNPLNALMERFDYILSYENNKDISEFISKNLKSIHGVESLYAHIFRQLINHKNTSLIITALQAGLNPNLSSSQLPIIYNVIIAILEESTNDKRESFLEVLNAFIKYNTDLNVVTSYQQNTIIHWILNHTNNNNHLYSLKLLKFFLPLLKDPLKKNKSGESPIDIANTLRESDINKTDFKNLLLLYEYLS